MATKKNRPDRSGAGVKMPDPQADNLPPGSRSVQRDSRTQLEEDRHPAREDEATAWERELQNRLPPRGDGSRHNQGEDKDTRTISEDVAEDRGPAASLIAQMGGTRGPNKTY
jgi:hypothetical protein